MFKHTLKVAEIAYIVSTNTGKEYYNVRSKVYCIVCDDDCNVCASITQTAIRDGISTAKRHRTKIRNRVKVSEPGFCNPAIKLNNQSWKLNLIAHEVVAHRPKA